jgi:hypothetical protein
MNIPIILAQTLVHGGAYLLPLLKPFGTGLAKLYIGAY